MLGDKKSQKSQIFGMKRQFQYTSHVVQISSIHWALFGNQRHLKYIFAAVLTKTVDLKAHINMWYCMFVVDF